ncbi:MAG: DNA adenine methylase [Peptococcaceae bacterium]|nr:DNA adenine methylase [Peptococcaceae bacterium]
MKPILRYPGAKWRAAPWILKHLPPHKVYLEPYFGSGAVFFNKTPCKIETINDIDENVVNLFKVIRERFSELATAMQTTPWARSEYYASYGMTSDSVENARRFLVRCWQAHATRLGVRTGWRHSVAIQSPSCSSQWRQLPNRIEQARARLMEAQIECMDALKLIAKYNHKDVLIYADPPYMPNTRQRGIYATEMKDSDHVNLLEALMRHRGSVVVSGYESDLYNSTLSNWTVVKKNVQTERGVSKTECLWIKPLDGGG